MILSVCVSQIAMAQASDVMVENHTQSGGYQAVSDFRIDNVFAPQEGDRESCRVMRVLQCSLTSDSFEEGCTWNFFP